ncbi:MAG: MFS transporter [Desulfobulbaceae bacterium]|nr:MFS transporter [Desulfobulbaceae bacterium]
MQSSPGALFFIPNIPQFIAFRVFFNARFYYPVFTILFLDFGLTIEQFALLNTVWAATIVLAEVPSGALADIVGRKRLLVATSLLMMVELLLICFVPLGNMTLVFWIFFLNRILSGLAEAMASGADEALAYDTLAERGQADDWPKVLDLQMRMQSAGFVITMTLGALVYDPDTVNQVLQWMGAQTAVTQQTTMRYPLYLTLLLSFFALIATLSMRDPQVNMSEPYRDAPLFQIISKSFKLTWQVGRWIVMTPFALAVILFGMTCDHSLRMIVTMESQYLRLINYPEASFGLIGSGLGMLGLLVPRIARSMTERYTPARNLLILSMITLAGLWGLVGFFPYYGLLPMVLVFVGMMLTSFFTSHYLNKITGSEQRATVLSFKGLSFNLAYGMIGILYAGLITHLRGKNQMVNGAWSQQAIENQAFRDSISWFPWYTVVMLSVLFFFFWRYREHQIFTADWDDNK